MKTIYRRSSSFSIPGYNHNAVLQLIVASGVGFISYHLVRVVMLVADTEAGLFHTRFTTNLGLPAIHALGFKLWTVLTYGWIHIGFWELFSNMIWLYCFGSIVQMLIGHRQIIPLFFYSLVAGGIFYLLSQLIPGLSPAIGYLFGAQAGVVALAVASLTLAPNYRMYFTPTFSIPLVVVACVFFALIVMNSNLEVSRLMLLAGGAAMGYVYIKLTQNGYKPGAWMYDLPERISNMAEPDARKATYRQNNKRNQILNNMYEPKRGISQKRIDDILDKIHQQGYNSLTKEEKEALVKASKED